MPHAAQGYAGGYNFRRVQVSGDERFRDVPDKNMYSHVCDADQYLMVGAGEGRSLTMQANHARARANLPRFAISEDSM